VYLTKGAALSGMPPIVRSMGSEVIWGVGSADYLYRRHRIFGLATGQNAPRQKYLHVRQQH
jgi:hypothetical protein